MAARQTIGDQIGAALQRLKGRARDAFLATRKATSDTPLTSSELAGLMMKIWAAVGAAVTPISPDNSIIIETVNDANGDPQLSLRATAASPPLKSELLPLPDGVAALGNEGRWADGQHRHPLARPSKIRFYLSDSHGTGEYTGHLLLTVNPYVEANAVDLGGQSSHWFVSQPGVPGLSVWQGGGLHAHLRLKLRNPQPLRTYKLYTNDDLVYHAIVYEWVRGDAYMPAGGPFAEQPTVSTDYVTLDLDIPVKTLAAGTDGRLGVELALRAYVGGSEVGLNGEQLVVRVGGDDASYFDTLFTPSGGFSGVHSDLDQRNAANSHPQEAITPGRIQTPATPVVTTDNGHFAVPVNSNFVLLEGTEDILGCSTSQWIGYSEFEACVLRKRKLLRSQLPLLADHDPFIWGSADSGYGADYDVITLKAGAVFRCRHIGSVWRVCSLLNV